MRYLQLFLLLSIFITSNSYGLSVSTLEQAIKKDNLEVIKSAPKDYLAFGIRDRLGRNALFMAVIYKSRQVATYLINNKIGIETPDYFGRTVLMIAATDKNNYDTFYELLGANASCFHKDKDGRDLLFYAKISKNEKILQLATECLSEKKSNTDIPVVQIKELYSAIEQFDLQGINSFFTQFARLDVTIDGKNKAMDIILGPNFLEKVALGGLMKLGINVNQKDEKGDTPLIRAINAKNATVITKLLKEKARPDIVNKKLQDALMVAFEVQLDMELTQQLASNTLNLQKTDQLGNTAAHYAVEFSNLQAIDLLIGLNAPMDVPNNNGITPALLAAKLSKGSTLKRLVEIGCSVSITDEFGRDVVMIIAQNDPTTYLKMRGHLKQNDYDFKKQDISGKTGDNYYHEFKVAADIPSSRDSLGTSSFPSIDPTDLDIDLTQRPDYHDPQVSTAALKTSEVANNQFIQKLIKVIHQNIGHQTLLYTKMLQGIVATGTTSSQVLHSKVAKKTKELQERLKDTRLSLNEQMIKMPRYLQELHSLKIKRQAKKQEVEGAFSSYRGHKRKYLEYINKSSQNLSELSKRAEELNRQVELVKKGQDDISLEKQQIRQQISILVQNHRQLLQQIEDDYQYLVQRAKADLDLEISSFDGLNKQYKDLKEEKRKLLGKVGTLNSIITSNLNFIQDPEHQKKHVPQIPICPYLTENDQLNKRISNIKSKVKAVKEDLKALGPRLKRKKSIIAKARQAYKAALKEHKVSRDNAKAEAKKDHLRSKQTLEDSLTIVEDEGLMDQEELALEVESLNALIADNYGDHDAVTSSWNNIQNFATTFSSTDKDQLLCYGIVAAYIGCKLKDGFHNQRNKYQLAPAFLSEYDSISDDLGFAYGQYLNKSLELNSLNHMITVFNSKIQSIEAMRRQISELQQEIEKEEKTSQNVQKTQKTDKPQQSKLREMVLQYAQVQSEILLMQFSLDQLDENEYKQKVNELEAPKTFLAKYSFETLEQFATRNLKPEIVTSTQPSSNDNLEFNILDPTEIKEQISINGDEKKRFISALYQIFQENVLDGTIWDREIGRVLSNQALLSMSEVIKVKGDGRSGYALVTPFGQFLVGKNGELIEYDLADYEAIDFITIANDIERSIMESTPKTDVGKQAKVMGLAAINLSKIEYRSSSTGSKEEAALLMEISKEMLSLALDLTPGISLGKDTYEVLTGKNMITGKQLQPMERVFPVLSIATLGMLKYAKYPLKITSSVLLKMYRHFKKSGGRVVGASVEVVLGSARKIWGSARKFVGNKVDDVKLFVSELKATKVGEGVDNSFNSLGRLQRNGKRNVLFQADNATCGPTSCGMVLDTYGKKVSVSSLVKEVNTTSNGVSIDKLAPLLKNKGVSAEFKMGLSVDDIAKATSKGEPMIVAVREGSSGHAVVVDGITKRFGTDVVAVRDPWKDNGGEYFELLENFRGRFLRQGIVTRNK